MGSQGREERDAKSTRRDGAGRDGAGHEQSGVPALTIHPATPSDLPTIRALFSAYAASLNFSLCFQDFSRELDELPGRYAPPRGLLLLATHNSTPAGCVALRPLDDATCEMKRLYVRPEARGHGLGRALANRLIDDARALGYARMRLDTVPSVMASAVAMYRGLGFREIEPYCENPVPGALFFELNL